MRPPQPQQRPDRIGAPPVEGTPVLAGEAFGQHQPAIGGVGKGQPGRDHERHARAEFGDDAAERRADDEAKAERHTDQPEIGGAALGRRDIGDIGISGREGRAGDPRHQPRRDQPGQRRRKAHGDIVEAIGQQAGEQHRPPSEAIGQSADHRAGDELGDGVEEHHPAADQRRGVERLAGQRDDQTGQHRDDDPEANGVDQHRHEDEGQRAAF